MREVNQSDRQLVERSIRGDRDADGRVVDERGQPVAGANPAVVIVLPGQYSAPLPSTMVLSDEEGRFTMDSLPPAGGHIGLVRGA